MNNKTIRYLSMGIGYSIGAIGTLFTLIALTNTGDDDKASLDTDLNVFFWAVYIGIMFCAVFTVGAGIVSAIKNPKGAMGSLGGILLLAAVVGISYALASDYVSWVGKPDEIAALNDQYSSGSRKFSGMAVNAMWMLLLGSIAALFGMEIFRIVKSKR